MTREEFIVAFKAYRRKVGMWALGGLAALGITLVGLIAVAAQLGPALRAMFSPYFGEPATEVVVGLSPGLILLPAVAGMIIGLHRAERDGTNAPIARSPIETSTRPEL